MAPTHIVEYRMALPAAAGTGTGCGLDMRFDPLVDRLGWVRIDLASRVCELDYDLASFPDRFELGHIPNGCCQVAGRRVGFAFDVEINRGLAFGIQSRLDNPGLMVKLADIGCDGQPAVIHRYNLVVAVVNIVEYSTALPAAASATAGTGSIKAGNQQHENPGRHH